MGTNIILFAFCCLMIWLLYRYKLVSAATQADFLKVAPVFIILTVFLTINAVMAFMGRHSLKFAMEIVPVSSWETLTEVETGTGIIIAGTVSPDNPDRYGNGYLAFIDDKHLWSPPGLLIDLQGGAVPVGNDTYATRNWPVDARNFSYLKAGQAVVIVGRLDRYSSLPVSDEEEYRPVLKAEIIYAGGHAGFIESARNKIVMPTIMLVANLCAAVITVLLPLMRFWGLTPISSPISSTYPEEKVSSPPPSR